MIMKYTVSQIYREFVNRYSYIAVEKETIEEYLKNYKRDDDMETILNNLQDYVLSNGLEYEVEL